MLSHVIDGVKRYGPLRTCAKFEVNQSILSKISPTDMWGLRSLLDGLKNTTTYLPFVRDT